MICHIASNFDKNTWHCDDFDKIDRLSVQFILFLSKMLIEFEKRYWSTKLEIVALVWMIKKIRHMIEIAIKIIVIFTNYFASTSIARQTSLTFNNTDKLNLKLIRAFAYLSQFDLNVQYKSEKINIISNGLFRLSRRKVLKKSFTNCFLTNVLQISLMIRTNSFNKDL